MHSKILYLNRTKEAGAAMVEFSIVALFFFMVLFMTIELGRWMYIWNTLGEVTRRGARVATVCGINDNYIKQAAVFGTTKTTSGDMPILNGLTTDRILISYFDSAGTPSKDSSLPAALQNFFVEVRVVNFQHQFIAPLIGRTIELPLSGFATRLPMESKGNLQSTSGSNPNHCQS